MNATSRTDATPERIGRLHHMADYLAGATLGSRRLDRAFVAQLAEVRGWRTTAEIAAGLGINRSTYFRMLRGDHETLQDTANYMAANASQQGETVTVKQLFPIEQAA